MRRIIVAGESGNRDSLTYLWFRMSQTILLYVSSDLVFLNVAGSSHTFNPSCNLFDLLILPRSTPPETSIEISVATRRHDGSLSQYVSLLGWAVVVFPHAFSSRDCKATSLCCKEFPAV